MAGITASLAENSRIPLLDRPAPFQPDGRFVLWLALLLAILGAAELWARLWHMNRSNAGPAAEGAGTVPLGVAVIVLCAGSTGLLLYESEQLALEQLRTATPAHRSRASPPTDSESSSTRSSLSAPYGLRPTLG